MAKLFALYKEAVEALDEEIGFLLDLLKGEGLYEQAAVIFTADHGEQFMEHGELGHPAHLYDEQLHVPLIVRPGGAGARAFEVDEPVSLLDLAPTIAGLAGVDQSPSFMGEPLPLVPRHPADEKGVSPVVAFGSVEGDSYCYRKGRWKFISAGEAKELYDLQSDPGELDNRYQSDAEMAREVEVEAFEYLRGLRERHYRVEVERNRIKDLATRLKRL